MYGYGVWFIEMSRLSFPCAHRLTTTSKLWGLSLLRLNKIVGFKWAVVVKNFLYYFFNLKLRSVILTWYYYFILKFVFFDIFYFRVMKNLFFRARESQFIKKWKLRFRRRLLFFKKRKIGSPRSLHFLLTNFGCATFYFRRRLGFRLRRRQKIYSDSRKFKRRHSSSRKTKLRRICSYFYQLRRFAAIFKYNFFCFSLRDSILLTWEIKKKYLLLTKLTLLKFFFIFSFGESRVTAATASRSYNFAYSILGFQSAIDAAAAVRSGVSAMRFKLPFASLHAVFFESLLKKFFYLTFFYSFIRFFFSINHFNFFFYKGFKPNPAHLLISLALLNSGSSYSFLRSFTGGSVGSFSQFPIYSVEKQDFFHFIRTRNSLFIRYSKRKQKRFSVDKLSGRFFAGVSSQRPQVFGSRDQSKWWSKKRASSRQNLALTEANPFNVSSFNSSHLCASSNITIFRLKKFVSRVRRQFRLRTSIRNFKTFFLFLFLRLINTKMFLFFQSHFINYRLCNFTSRFFTITPTFTLKLEKNLLAMRNLIFFFLQRVMIFSTFSSFFFYKTHRIWIRSRVVSFVISTLVSAYLLKPCWVNLLPLWSFVGRSWRKFIFRTLFWSTKNFFLPRKVLSFFKKLLFIFIASFKFKNFYVFMRYLTMFFFYFRRRQWVVRRSLRVLILESLFQLKSLTGWQLQLSGKFSRRPRAKTITWYRLAKPSFQNSHLQVLTCERQLTTDFGNYNFRFWVYWY